MTKLTELNAEQLTANQPFCAGVLLFQNRNLLVTLNDDLSDGQKGVLLRVGGVGGGQEPGETLSECALREAREELETDRVRLVPSEITYFHDMDTDACYPVVCSDALPPFLLQRITNQSPDKPYKSGLPVGPYLYFGIYKAECEEQNLKPGDDVDGLLYVPLDSWNRLLEQPTLSEVLALGFELIESSDLKRSLRLFVPDSESFLTVVRLLKQSTE